LFSAAVGDVHGCLEKLKSLLIHMSLASWVKQIIFLGDYIDRGPASRQVVDLLIRMQADQPGMILCIRGNHEEMLLKAASSNRTNQDVLTWLHNGGVQTLESYGVDDPMDLPVEHLTWMRGLPLHFMDDHRLFVHAGVRPGVPLTDQSTNDILWIREPFLSSREEFGPLVVHGHTVVRSGLPDLRGNRLNLDTGACFGGPLTSAIFSDHQRRPCLFVNDRGDRRT
jgi:serine/threonine protein phosphatase 1